jgi:hypothetical protein
MLIFAAGQVGSTVIAHNAHHANAKSIPVKTFHISAVICTSRVTISAALAWESKLSMQGRSSLNEFWTCPPARRWWFTKAYASRTPLAFPLHFPVSSGGLRDERNTLERTTRKKWYLLPTEIAGAIWNGIGLSHLSNRGNSCRFPHQIVIKSPSLERRVVSQQFSHVPQCRFST